jgi:hypothetical protein
MVTHLNLCEVVVRCRYSPVVDDDLKNGLIWWSTHRATIGLVVRDGVVVEYAPYARRWAQGRDAREIYRKGQQQKGVTLAWVPATEPEQAAEPHLDGAGRSDTTD